MRTLASILRAEFVALELGSRMGSGALEEVAGLLCRNPAVSDWETFYKQLQANPSCLPDNDGKFGICIPHARTGAVSDLVMSVGRSSEGVRFEGIPYPVRYVFCIGLPSALNAEYLRIVGLLARILRDPEGEAELREAASRGAFLQTLGRLEAKL